MSVRCVGEVCQGGVLGRCVREVLGRFWGGVSGRCVGEVCWVCVLGRCVGGVGEGCRLATRSALLSGYLGKSGHLPRFSSLCSQSCKMILFRDFLTTLPRLN